MQKIIFRVGNFLTARIVPSLLAAFAALYLLSLLAFYQKAATHLETEALEEVRGLKTVLATEMALGRLGETERRFLYGVGVSCASLYGKSGNLLVSLGELPFDTGDLTAKGAQPDDMRERIIYLPKKTFTNLAGNKEEATLLAVVVPLEPGSAGLDGRTLLIAFDNTASEAAMRGSLLNFAVYSGLVTAMVAFFTVFVVKRMKGAEEKAREAARETVDLKNHVLSTVSHELRTPLNGIVGMITILKDTELTGEQKNYAEVAERCASDLMTLVNKILEHIKFETGKAVLADAEFEPSVTAALAVDYFLPAAHEKGILLTLEADPAVKGKFLGDEEKLHRVLSTLLDNAVRFTRTGEVRVRTKLASKNKNMARVRFTVSDTGIGIPPEKMEAIFRPLTQADQSHTRQYGGLGLGLSLAWALVKNMGGEISAVSEAGKGSTFVVELPFPEAPMAAAPAGGKDDDGKRPALRPAEDLADRFGGDLETVRRVRFAFGTDAAGKAASIVDSLSVMNVSAALASTRELIHAASTMGADVLCEAARELEGCLVRGDMPGATKCLARLKREAERVQAALSGEP